MGVFWSIVILLVANVVTIGAMLLVRRGAPEGSYFQDGDRASGVFGVIAGGFAIFAGFIIFLAFTTYDQSRSGGETEALTLVQQFQTAEFLPDATKRRLTGEIVCYGRSVVYQEWPLMEAGNGSDAINPWTIALFREPEAGESEERERAGRVLQVARSDLGPRGGTPRSAPRRGGHHPGSIWLVLFLIAGVIFAFMLFFADSGEGPGPRRC